MSDQPANTFQVHPIGYVRQGDQGFYLDILEPYRPGLKMLDRFSHAHVFWWFQDHDNDQDRNIMQQDLPYAPGTVAGVFATRSNYRPNPIALSTCFLFDVDEKNGTVHVGWIDALEGTPVLDLKPYIPVSDRIRDVKVAEWFAKWPQWLEDAADFDWESVGLGE
jgi:tRNA-Thr(GGU) m(6)t(6)A37 methyltransferase TsaA